MYWVRDTDMLMDSEPGLKGRRAYDRIMLCTLVFHCARVTRCLHTVEHLRESRAKSR